ncbi:hypothetical protein D9M71_558170 [compost metagenome]
MLRATDIASKAGVRYLITSSALAEGSMRLPTRTSNGSLNIARNLASAALTVGWATNSFSAARVRLRACISASNTTIRLISALRSSLRFMGAPGPCLLFGFNSGIDMHPSRVETCTAPMRSPLPPTARPG